MPRAKALSAVERQNQIMDVLAEQGHASVEMLGKLLGVSKMTVHRDLDALANEKRVRKVHGGAALSEEPKGEGDCTFCHSHIPTDSRTKVTLHLTDGTHRHACCPHCGLLAVPRLGGQVATVLVTDFLYGRIINARTAAYVYKPGLDICCAPTTLAFHQTGDAERFKRGFGGEVFTFEQAIEVLHAEMILSSD